jgi:TatD DNase family protein
MIIDVHAHLDFFSKNKLKKIQENQKIKLVITNSVNIKSIEKNLKISKKYPKIKLAVGLYPENNLSSNDLIFLSKIIKEIKSKIIAIGEIGMDFSNEFPNKQLQKEIFMKQLEIAKQLNIPAIIHTRKAEKEIIDILEEEGYSKIVLHCFSGNFKLIKKAIDLGYYFSIPTNIVRSEHFQKAIQLIPKNKILTETDSPYLSPFKEKQNEPAFIEETIKKMSEIWQISKEEVEKIIERNFNELFY